MRKLAKYISSVIFAGGFILCLISTFYFWWKHPELSHMEVFQHHWPFIIGGNVCAILAVVLGFFEEWKEL